MQTVLLLHVPCARDHCLRAPVPIALREGGSALAPLPLMFRNGEHDGAGDGHRDTSRYGHQRGTGPGGKQRF